MTHLDSDAALDALLGAADSAVLHTLDQSVNIDGGRAAIFATVTSDERLGTQDASTAGYAPGQHSLSIVAEVISNFGDPSLLSEEVTDPALGSADFVVSSTRSNLLSGAYPVLNAQLERVLGLLEEIAETLARMEVWLIDRGFGVQERVELQAARNTVIFLHGGLSHRVLDRGAVSQGLREAKRSLDEVDQLVRSSPVEVGLTFVFIPGMRSALEGLVALGPLIRRLFSTDDDNTRVPAPTW